MSVAAARQITGTEEALVSEAAFADEMAGRRALWWAGIPGLDPLHPATGVYGAQMAAMGCGAHVLGPDLPGNTRFFGGHSLLTREFYEWLVEKIGDDMDSHLRRMALRHASSIPDLPAGKVLHAAKALHAAVPGL